MEFSIRCTVMVLIMAVDLRIIGAGDAKYINTSTINTSRIYGERVGVHLTILSA